MNPTGTVVVGVDGSPESRAAIEFAMREATRRQTSLRVIAAAQLPEYWTIAYGSADLPAPEQVLAPQPPVEGQAALERLEGRILRAGEASAPELRHASTAAFRRTLAATMPGRP